MTTAAKLALCASTALWLAPLAARAEDKEYVGRTGLPTVREGKNEVWMERGLVTLKVVGDKLHTTQVYQFRYPAPPLETGSEKIKMAVREDFFQDASRGAIDPGHATTFDSFKILVDDKAVTDEADSWVLNDKKDTATRWRNWWMTFNPGDVHTVRIEAVAPLGWDGANRYVNFIAKDLGGLRKDPDYLEIRFEGPEGASGPVVASLEPKPSDNSRNAARWVFRRSNPKRDVLIKLPATYRPASASGL